MELQQFRDSIKSMMGEYRYRHSLGTEAVACDLALIHGYDTRKASIAGILHDCAKDLSDEALIKECIRYHLPISEYERQSVFLLHAKVSSAYAEDLFEIKDEDILSSIRYHTTGRPGMSLLEKIIFISDYIEPNRKQIEDIDRIRWEAYNHLDRAVILTLDHTLKYLESTGSVIDPLTREAYEYYNALYKED